MHGRGPSQATSRPSGRLWIVSTDLPQPAVHRDLLMAGPRRHQLAPADTGPSQLRAAEAAAAITALYQVHAVGLIRLAVVLLGDRPTAEDVVQDAFGRAGSQSAVERAGRGMGQRRRHRRRWGGDRRY